MKFEIGEKVKAHRVEEDHTISVGIGVVTDILESRRAGVLYEVQFDGWDAPCDTLYDEGDLVKVIETDPTLSFKIDIAENVVVAIMLQGDKQIGRGHGHIIHEGSLGVAQAASYAMKMLYSNMNGGSFIGGEYRGR